jgi:hypothetical protein
MMTSGVHRTSMSNLLAVQVKIRGSLVITDEKCTDRWKQTLNARSCYCYYYFQRTIVQANELGRATVATTLTVIARAAISFRELSS